MCVFGSASVGQTGKVRSDGEAATERLGTRRLRASYVTVVHLVNAFVGRSPLPIKLGRSLFQRASPVNGDLFLVGKGLI